MGRPRIPWDLDNVKQRLLKGDRVRDIAEDEGLTPNGLSIKFRHEVGRSPRAWALQENPELAEIRFFRNKRSLPIDEHYFDGFQENPREDRAYLLGVFYGRPVTSIKNEFHFGSKDKTLLDLIHTKLKAGHQLVEQSGGSYLLRITGIHHLYQTLCSLGVEGLIQERSFPKIPEIVLDDFMRGIVETNSGVWVGEGRSQIMFARFGLSFARTMNDLLAEYAGVSRPAPSSSRFSYNGSDVRKIAEFIYLDEEYFQSQRLFVPEIREKLEGCGGEK